MLLMTSDSHYENKGLQPKQKMSLKPIPTFKDGERPHGLQVQKTMFELETRRGPRAERGRAFVKESTYPKPSHKPTQTKGNLKTHYPRLPHSSNNNMPNHLTHHVRQPSHQKRCP
jgi:hypothetical protein